MELWDAYDKNLNKIDGFTLIRGEPIPDGMLHLVCSIIVRHIDGDYLLMRRDDRKMFGGLWEVSAGGSALQGESADGGARRELYEETGIKFGELRKLGMIVNEEKKTIYAYYLFTTAIEKDRVVMQEGETSDYQWVTGNELMAIPQDKLITSKELLRDLISELC